MVYRVSYMTKFLEKKISEVKKKAQRKREKIIQQQISKPRRKAPPSIKRIVDYACENVDESRLACDLGDYPTAPSEKRRICWRCGRKKAVERCHIIPHSLGGSNDPSNFVLLCKTCHAECPDVNDKEFMFEWIEKTKRDHFTVHLDLYKFWTGRDMQDDLDLIRKKSDVSDEEILKIFSHIIGNKFCNEGEVGGHSNNDETTNYLVRKSIEELKKKYNICD